MKKYISLLLAAVVTACCLSGCGQKISNTQTNENGQSTEISENDSQKMKVVTTIFPEYDWVKQIAGEEASNLELTMLLDNGVDLHS